MRIDYSDVKIGRTNRVHAKEHALYMLFSLWRIYCSIPILEAINSPLLYFPSSYNAVTKRRLLRLMENLIIWIRILILILICHLTLIKMYRHDRRTITMP